ncbi:MAG TPA: hypothetical protein VEC36_04815 [Patescibacteria group bacterium]|nr:hypothetical protein [Patescibacteria group bacterium]
MKLRIFSSLFVIGVLALGAGGCATVQEESDPLNPRSAPPRLYVGPVGGYNYAVHTGEFASIPNNVNNSPVPCPIFDGGTNNGFYAGMTMEYLIGNRAVTGEDPVSSIIGKLVYNSLPGYFDIEGLPYKVVDANGQPVNTEVKHVNNVTYQTIDLDLLYKLNLFGTSFGVVAGPTIGFAMGTAQQDQRFELVSPLNARFEEDPQAASKGLKYSADGRTITISEGDLPNASGFRLGIKAGVQYEMPLFGSTRYNLIPHVFYNFGITKLTSAENWRVNALQAGVDFRFAL